MWIIFEVLKAVISVRVLCLCVYSGSFAPQTHTAAVVLLPLPFESANAPMLNITLANISGLTILNNNMLGMKPNSHALSTDP